MVLGVPIFKHFRYTTIKPDQTILKAHFKFQNDRSKTEGGVARTVCILPIHFCDIRALNSLSLNAKK